MAAQPLAPAPVAAVSRPTVVTVALVLLALMGLISLIPQPGSEEIPRAVIVSGYAFALFKIVAAVGLWRCRRWAAILGFVAVLLDALTAVPGIFFAPSAGLQALAGVWILVSIVLLALLVLPAARRAYR